MERRRWRASRKGGWYEVVGAGETDVCCRSVAEERERRRGREEKKDVRQG